MNEPTVQHRRCEVEGCRHPGRIKRNLCPAHYIKWLKYGDPLAGRCHRRGPALFSVENGFAYIELTKGYRARVDLKNLPWIRQHNWYATSAKNGMIYAAAQIIKNGNRVTCRMHREIMNAPRGKDVDHRDWDSLNNVESNLRVVPRYKNLQNRDKQANNTSGHKGVHMHKASGLWHAEIRYRGKKISLGYHREIEDAARAYNKKARELGFLYVPPDPE